MHVSASTRSEAQTALRPRAVDFCTETSVSARQKETHYKLKQFCAWVHLFTLQTRP